MRSKNISWPVVGQERRNLVNENDRANQHAIATLDVQGHSNEIHICLVKQAIDVH